MSNAKKDEPKKVRVLVADDHPLLREGIVQFLNRQSDVTCCGEVDTAAEAHVAVGKLKPDLLLLDLRLGNTDGIDFIKTLRVEYPTLPVLVLSQHDEAVYAERVLAAGAGGYIMKQEATTEVLHAIRTVMAGELYVSRKMSARVLRKLLDTRPQLPRTGVERLTDRELQVLQLLGSGLSSKEIASELNLSVKTIETYRENLKNKLGLQNSANLIRYASDWVQGKLPS
jgi:two-component system, NarL family, response regulator NreC